MNLDMEKNVNFKMIYVILLKNTLDFNITKCRNPNFGLATKVKGLQGCGPKGSP